MYFSFFHVSEVIFHDLKDKGDVVFLLDDACEITVRALTEDEAQSVNIHVMGGYAVRLDLYRTDIPRRPLEVFGALAHRKLPEGIDLGEQNREFVNEDGTFKEQFYDEGGLRIEIPLLVFDNGFQTFVRSVSEEGTERITNFIKTLRWRGNGSGPNLPIKASRNPIWSFDKKTWHLLPTERKETVFEHTSMLLTTPEVKKDVIRFISEGIKESLSHELLYEAWNQRGESPRSALILAIAAAEIGLKRCVMSLAPDATWFVENLPSPPIERILEHYLPTLKGTCTVNEKTLPPPKEIMKTLKKGVKLRNDAVHGTLQGLTSDNLREILLAVQETLWLLEFYSGHAWAWEYVSESTKYQLEHGS